MRHTLRRRLAATCLLLGSVLLAGQVHPLVPSAEATGAADDRPNLVLITTDDQALSDLAWMPLTRAAIGGAGLSFRNGLAPHPLCCPARAEFLTGQYAQNNGVRSNSGPHGGYDALVEPGNTLPVWLREAGYRTGFTGKYLNGWNADRHGVTPGWDHFDPMVRGIFSGYGTTMYEHGTPRRYDQTHTSDVVTDSATSMVQRWSAEAPFFVWASYSAPHGTCSETAPLCDDPPIPARRHAGAYAGVRAPSLDKPSFSERNMRDKPRWMRTLPRPGRRLVQRLFTQRIRSLASVDEGVAAIVESLRAAGELENTLIVVTSDNGYLLGEHRYLGKILAFDESLRVPLLMRGPGITPGSRTGMEATLVDLSTTLASAAGVSPGREPDGVDLLPVARGTGAWSRRTVLVMAGPRRRIGTREWTFRGVRTPRYTFTRWDRTGFLELYDRRRDRFELTNVARDRRYRRVVRVLGRRTTALAGCAGAECVRDFGRVPRPRR